MIGDVKESSRIALTSANCVSLQILSQDEGVSSRNIVSWRYSLTVKAVRQSARFRGSSRALYTGSSAHVPHFEIAYNTAVSLYDPEVSR